MKKQLIMFLVLILSVPVIADEAGFFTNGFAENSTTYVFASTVRVRNFPEIKSNNVTDTLNPGHEVVIIRADENTYTMNGISENWVYISYKTGGIEKKGYIWGGLLALGYVKKGDTLILAGMKNFKPGNGLQGECRVVESGKVISSAGFEFHSMPESDIITYRYSVAMKLYDNRGLSGVENVISVYCEYGACGYPFGNIWFAFGGGKLYYLGKETSVSEAGVFHVEEKFVFPSDDTPLKDQVVLVRESYEFDESVEDYKLSEKTERKFSWKNKKLVE